MMNRTPTSACTPHRLRTHLATVAWLAGLGLLGAAAPEEALHYRWIEAEQLAELSPEARRRTMLESLSFSRDSSLHGVSQNEGLELRKPGAWARGEVMIPAAGRYWLWSRSDDCETARPYVIEITGERYHVIAEAAGERRRAWTWHRVAEVVLPRGPARITIRKPSEGAYVWLDCLLLTNDRDYVPTGAEQRHWLANQEHLVPVDLREGYPGRPAPSHRLPAVPATKPSGPADYRRTLFIYPHRDHYLVELDRRFWGRKRNLVPFFDLPRVPWRLAEVVVYPPPDIVFESAQAQIEAKATVRPVVDVRHGALALRGDLDLVEGGRLVLRSGGSEAGGLIRRQERTTRVRAHRTASGCEVDCVWGGLRFDVYGRLCSVRLHKQRRAYDLIDAPLDCPIVSRRPATLAIESGVEAETGWEHVRLTYTHDLPDGTAAMLSYTVAEDSFVTFDFSFGGDRERELVLGWDMSDRLRELWYLPRGPQGRDRYGLGTFAGKRRYVEIDRAPADELIPDEDARKALSLELLDGANCHFAMLPRFFDGTEHMQVSRDRAVRFRVRAKRYSNTFLLHFYPTTNYNPRRLFTAGTGGGFVREAYDPYRPMRPLVYFTATPGGRDAFRPFLASHLMPQRDISRWGDWDLLLRPDQYDTWRSAVSQYGVAAGHYYQNNPAMRGTLWSPYVRRDRTFPTWFGCTTKWLPARTKVCMASPYWEHYFWQIMEAVQRRGEKFIYFDAFLPPLCENRLHCDRSHLAIFDIVQFLRRLRANAPDALIVLHGHPSVDIFAYRRYCFYMPGEGGAGREGELVNESDLAPFEWGATCYPLRPKLDELGMGYFWTLVRKLVVTGNHPFPFRAMINYNVPADPDWEAMTRDTTLSIRYGLANAMSALVRTALANLHIETIDRSASDSLLGVKEYACYRGNIAGLPAALLVVCDGDGEIRLNPRVWPADMVFVEPVTGRVITETDAAVSLAALRRVWGQRAPVPICAFDRRLMNIGLSLSRTADGVRVTVSNRTGVPLKNERLLLRSQRRLLDAALVSLASGETRTYPFRVAEAEREAVIPWFMGKASGATDPGPDEAKR